MRTPNFPTSSIIHLTSFRLPSGVPRRAPLIYFWLFEKKIPYDRCPSTHCQLVASVWRQDGQASFDLPDLSEETDAAKHNSTLRAPQELVSYYLYAIVESASTAGTPTLSAAEKQQDKKHRNINRCVSRSVFVGAITMNRDGET